MYKTIIKIDKEERGRVTLKFNKGNYETEMWFDDESQFQGFCFALKMMLAMGADSFGCTVPDSETTEKQDDDKNTEGDHQPG